MGTIRACARLSMSYHPSILQRQGIGLTQEVVKNVLNVTRYSMDMTVLDFIVLNAAVRMWQKVRDKG